MIPEPGADREVPVNRTFHEQIDDELIEMELKHIEADGQAIQTILLGLPEEIYAVVDSCETAQEIWLRVNQMMKDYTQLYDFLKYNQKEVDDLRAERLAKTHAPLALMANSNNLYNYPVFHQDQPVSSTYMQQPQPNNNYNPQPSFNHNYMQQPMPNPEDITHPTTAMNMTIVLMAKAFKLNYLTLTNNNQRISSNPHNRKIAQLGMNMGQDRQMQMVGGNGVQNVRNQNGLIVVPRIANQNPNGNGNVVAARAEGNAIRNNGNQIRCYNCIGLGHLARNCTRILMRLRKSMQTASGTRTEKAPVYDSDRSAEVIQIYVWYVDSGCSKHMTKNLKLLINFVWKFLGTVRFGNDHVATILGFGDLQWGNILITRVYFVEGLGHNLFSVGQFCDSDLEVAFRRNTCFVRNLEGVDLLKG
ncbi:retrovirus-related pol polyprotein from transposon TNT 1-94, partial [Tanacetum coccineum]